MKLRSTRYNFLLGMDQNKVTLVDFARLRSSVGKWPDGERRGDTVVMMSFDPRVLVT